MDAIGRGRIRKPVGVGGEFFVLLSDVREELATLRKALVAQVTEEWPLSPVNTHVTVEVECTREGAAALGLGTSKPFHARLAALMGSEVRHGEKPLVAVRALKRLVPRVCSLVGAEVAALPEGGATVLARVGSGARVHERVPTQRGRVGETLTAIGARVAVGHVPDCVVLFSQMNSHVALQTMSRGKRLRTLGALVLLHTR